MRFFFRHKLVEHFHDLNKPATAVKQNPPFLCAALYRMRITGWINNSFLCFFVIQILRGQSTRQRSLHYRGHLVCTFELDPMLKRAIYSSAGFQISSSCDFLMWLPPLLSRLLTPMRVSPCPNVYCHSGVEIWQSEYQSRITSQSLYDKMKPPLWDSSKSLNRSCRKPR